MGLPRRMNRHHFSGGSREASSGDPERLRRSRLRGAAAPPRPHRRDHVRAPQGRPGRSGRGHRPRHPHQPPLRRGRPPGVRSPPLRDASHRRGGPEPRHRPRRRLGVARGLRVLRGGRSVPHRPGRADARRRPGRLGRVRHGRRAQPLGLDPAELPDGQPHGPGPVPRLPDLQLRADDAADRLVHAASDGRRDPRPARRGRAGEALPRSERPVRRAAAAGQPRGAGRRGGGPARGGHDPRRQPVHGVRPLSPGARLGRTSSGASCSGTRSSPWEGRSSTARRPPTSAR